MPPCSDSATQLRYKSVRITCDGRREDLFNSQNGENFDNFDIMSQQCQVNYTAAGVRAQGTTGMSVTSGDGAWPYADLFRADGLLYIASN